MYNNYPLNCLIFPEHIFVTIQTITLFSISTQSRAAEKKRKEVSDSSCAEYSVNWMHHVCRRFCHCNLGGNVKITESAWIYIYRYTSEDNYMFTQQQILEIVSAFCRKCCNLLLFVALILSVSQSLYCFRVDPS